MRHVDRSKSAPKELAAGQFQKMRESYLGYLKLDPKRRVQTRPPDRHLPIEPDLMPILNALFLGKCAFCETRHAELRPYRFRPTSEALPVQSRPDAYLHYGWLADAWSNLYPICPGCLPKRPNQFPVTGPRAKVPTAREYASYAKKGDGNWPFPIRERHVLLDPCKDAPDDHFRLADRGGILVADTERGRATIDHFSLNRPTLIRRRRSAFAALTRRKRREVAPDEEFAGLLAARGAISERPRPAAKKAAKKTAHPAKTFPSSSLALWRLTTIEISSFKSLENIRIEMPGPTPDVPDKTPAILILGENAAGKSTVLEAVALAMMPDTAQIKLVKEPSTLLLHPRFLGDGRKARRRQSEIKLTFTNDDGKAVSRKLTITSNGFQSDGSIPHNLPIFGYGAYRHYRSDYREWVPERPVISLFHTDDLLSNPESWLLKLSKRQFDMVIRVLRFVIGISFENIERKSKGRIRECLVVLKQDGATSRTPLYSVSSGFRTILALICDTMRWLMERNENFTTLTEARGILLIDEVEAHLHPRWKVTIMDGLRQALPNMTIIATTHDPLCVRGMLNGEVLVLQRIPGKAAGSKLPTMVETLTNLPDVTKLTVQQLLTSDLFSLFDTDDPATGQAMADLADMLSLRRSGRVNAADKEKMDALWKKFEGEINAALPVGSTKVSRIVQEAVATYVIEHRRASPQKSQKLRERTIELIHQALASI
jgi:predicted ATPase